MATFTPNPNITRGPTQASGSTHQFTGSVEITGSLTLNGSAVTGGGGGISWDGSTANGVATFKDADEATVESNLTFDGSTLTVTGDVSASTNISASSFYGSADNLSASYTSHDTNNPILTKLDATGKINAEQYLSYEYVSGHSYLYLGSTGVSRRPHLIFEHGLPGTAGNNRTELWSNANAVNDPFFLSRRSTSTYYPLTIWQNISDQAHDKVGINIPFGEEAAYRFDVSGSTRFQEDVTIGQLSTDLHQVTGTLGVSGSIFMEAQAASPTLDAAGAYLFSKNDSGTNEMFVMDGAGNETKISPHNSYGEWEYFSRNTKTGKVVRVKMEKMIRKLEELTGEKFIEDE